MSKELETKPCPFCHEKIKTLAIKCRYCNSALVPFDVNKNTSHTIINTIADGGPKAPIFISPTKDEYFEKKGHGIASLMFSILLCFISIDFFDDQTQSQDMIESTIIGSCILSTFILGYALWIYQQRETNKTLPVISIIICSFTIIFAFSQIPSLNI